ncbi:tail fiber protein [Vibrio phage Rostov 13]|uniref:Tail fiber protein n=1 Tax=Vibrio phage Rostov 13 TaxID=2875843 RepID=A0A8K1J892_9CAUD|nr:tail fiber protein [Vibrio phage Rostov 13]
MTNKSDHYELTSKVLEGNRIVCLTCDIINHNSLRSTSA